MFYSILEDLDELVRRWSDVDHCKAATFFVLAMYALFLLYSLTKHPIVQFFIFVSITLAVGYATLYIIEVNENYLRQRKEDDQTPCQTVCEEEQVLLPEEESDFDGQVETTLPTVEPSETFSPSVEPSTTE
jgi:hypothetical protein